MSNPISAALTQLSLDDTSMIAIQKWRLYDFRIYPDPVFGSQEELDELHKKHAEEGSIDKVRQMLNNKVNIMLRPSVLMQPAVKAGMVFNKGAETRLLAITQDSKLQLRKRTRVATLMRNLLLATMGDGSYVNRSDWGDYLDGSETGIDGKYELSKTKAVERGQTFFMASGGTQCALGRLKKALPVASLVVLKPATDMEVQKAYEASGFYHGGYWQTLFPEWAMDHSSLWPIVPDGEGACVRINKNASMGFPYSAPAKEIGVLEKVLEVVVAMEQSSAWSLQAAQTYKRMMMTQPGFVLFMGKTKADVYSKEKLASAMMRFYLVTPGHLKLYVQRLLQPFAGAKVSIGDAFNLPPAERYHALSRLHTAQKHGMTGVGPTQLVLAMDVQLHDKGYAYLHCGDDTLIAFYRYCTTGIHADMDGTRFTSRHLIIIGLDMSNFDLTQRSSVWEKVDDRLAQGMGSIDKQRAELWREIRRGRLTLMHGAGVTYVDGTGTSGIPGQSEVNDMIADIICQRFVAEVLRKPASAEGRVFFATEEGLETNGPPAFEVADGAIDAALGKIGREAGLDIRLEFIRSAPACWSEFDAGNLFVPDRVLRQQSDATKHYSMGATIRQNEVSFTFLGYNFGALDFSRDGKNFRFEEEMYQRECGDAETETVAGHGDAYGVLQQFPHRGVIGPEDFEFSNSGRGGLAEVLGEWARHYPEILVVPDMGRFTTNVLYANRFWVKERSEHSAYEVLRLYGMMLSSGHLFVDPAGRHMTRPAMQAILEQLRFSLWRQVVADPMMRLDLPEEENEFIGGLPLPDTIQALYKATDPRTYILKMIQIWEPYQHGKLPRRTLGVAAAQPLFSPPVGISVSWADIVEQEDNDKLAAIVMDDLQVGLQTMLYANNLQALALRAVTQKNWGRPPPSVALRHPTASNPVSRGTPATKTATQKRNQTKKKQKARRRAEAAAEEETRRHLEEQRREEEEIAELEEAMYRSDDYGSDHSYD